MSPFIRVEIVENDQGGYTSLNFFAREDTPESRESLDKILSTLLDVTRQKRGGAIPGNGIRIDVKHPPKAAQEESEEPNNSAK